jgi:hypothetical protein
VVSRLSLLKQVFRTWWARLITGGAIFIAFYQFACDQFGAPTLPNLWGMTGAAVPWWAWLLFAQLGGVYGLFEYVRRLSSEMELVQTGVRRAAAPAKVSNYELGSQITGAVATARYQVKGDASARTIEKAYFPIRALMLTLAKEKGIQWPSETTSPLQNLEAALRIMERIAPLIQAGHDEEAKQASVEWSERLNRANAASD